MKAIMGGLLAGMEDCLSQATYKKRQYIDRLYAYKLWMLFGRIRDGRLYNRMKTAHGSLLDSEMYDSQSFD